MKRLVAATAVVLALAACSSGGSASTSASITGSAAAQSSSPTTSAAGAETSNAESSNATSASSAATSTASGTYDPTAPKTPAKVVVDDLLGHRIEVTRTTRGLSSPVAPGKEIVLVEMTLTPGGVKGPAVGAESFVAEGGTNVTTSVQALLAQRSLSALPAEASAATSGAVAFAVTPGSTLAVSYVRPVFRSAKGRIFGETSFPLAV